MISCLMKIFKFSNPKVITNKETFLGDAVEVANNMHKVTNPEQSGSDMKNLILVH